MDFRDSSVGEDWQEEWEAMSRYSSSMSAPAFEEEEWEDKSTDCSSN